MGENLILNMASKGFTVSAFNRTVSKVTDFVEGRAKGQSIVGAYDLPQLVSQLSKPRKVMLMVKAGPAVDSFIEALIPLLEPGDNVVVEDPSYQSHAEIATALGAEVRRLRLREEHGWQRHCGASLTGT